MQRIGDSTSTANGAKEFTKGQPGSGVDATVITAEWLNAIQRELVNLVTGCGLTVTPGDDSQVLKAIQAIQLTAVTWSKLGGKPSTIAGFGISDAFTKTEMSSTIQKAVSDLVASSPAALDTLKELADALGNDPNFATTMTNALAGKAAKSTTLAGYGITDAYPKSVLYSRAEVDELLKSVSALPVGSMVPFPKGTVPPGFLEVDSSVQSIAALPDLYAYLGTTFNKGDEPAGYFRLPESRGEFLRGWDHGRGVDAGRSISSYQAGGGAVMGVEGRTSTSAGTIAPFNVTVPADGSQTPWLNTGDAANAADVDLRFSFNGAAVRPRNLTVMWCIKAWNASVNQGNIDIAALAPLAAQATEASRGTAKIATQLQVDEGTDDSAMTTSKKLRSAKSTCSAWVNWNGTGSVVVRDSYNVSSITDNGVGDFTVNLATPLSNANYSFSYTVGGANAINLASGASVAPTPSALRVISVSAAGLGAGASFQMADFPFNCVHIFGGK